MTNFPIELKRKIANLYFEHRKKLEGLDPTVMESFATEILKMIAREKNKSKPSHDLQVLEESMKHLKHDSITLKKYKPKSDDYEFALNDCQNLIKATRKWLKLEELI